MDISEYTVKPPKKYAKLRKKKLGLIFLYCFLTVASVFICAVWLPSNELTVAALVALLFLIGVFVFFSWRHVKPEYEYSLLDGELTISVIYSGATRKTLNTIDIRKAVLIAPTNGLYSSKLNEYSPENIYHFVFTPEQAEYFILFTDSDDKKAVAYIHAPSEIARQFKRLNARTVLGF